GGEQLGGHVEHGLGLIAGGGGVGDGRQGRHAGRAKGQGAGAAQRPLFRSGRLDQGAQVAAGLIQHLGIARGQADVQNQGGAVQPYLVFHGARALQVGQRGFQQAGGLVHFRKAAGQKRQPRAQAGVQRRRRRDRIHPPRRRQVAQQIEG